MISNPTIHVRHLRQCNICMNGARAWFKARDWPWNKFVAEGRPAADFTATGDPFALRVVAAAHQELTSGR